MKSITVLKNSPAVKAQRKRSIDKVRAAYAAGTLGALADSKLSCVYSNGTKTCIVGAMFTPEQLADIKRRRLNTMTGVHILAEKIGEDNIVASTGFSLRELNTLQAAHDLRYSGYYHPDTIRKFERTLKNLRA